MGESDGKMGMLSGIARVSSPFLDLGIRRAVKKHWLVRIYPCCAIFISTL